MKKKDILIVTFLILVLSTTGLAAGKKKPAMVSKIAKSREILGIVLGDVTLKDVTNKFGKARLWYSGDAYAARDQVCYKASESEYISFATHGEMAGPPENIVTHITVYGPGSKPPVLSEYCALLPKGAGPLQTKSGIRTGLTRAAVEKILGEPSEKEDDVIKYYSGYDVDIPKSDKNYEFLSKQKGCFPEGRDPFYSVGEELTLWFSEDRLIKFEIVRMEFMC